MPHLKAHFVPSILLNFGYSSSPNFTIFLVINYSLVATYLLCNLAFANAFNVKPASYFLRLSLWTLKVGKRVTVVRYLRSSSESTDAYKIVTTSDFSRSSLWECLKVTGNCKVYCDWFDWHKLTIHRRYWYMLLICLNRQVSYCMLHLSRMPMAGWALWDRAL